ncbi:recombinase family protein [Leuconostoc pseudomesenteroides]|uniref:recombinase family protein n=1 Tax=Leuconostoc pseudomesenteroides TaxID=33968 RepID=UPI0039EAED20
MKVGYARVSSQNQKLDRQYQELSQQGIKDELIFTDKLTGSKIEGRDGLNGLLNYIHEADIVVIVSLDRLSRNYNDTGTIINQIKNKGAKLQVLDLPDFSALPEPFDKMMLDVMVAIYKGIAENERAKIRERQAQGIALAKGKGVYQGQKSLYTGDTSNLKRRALYERTVELLSAGVPYAVVARKTGLARNTVKRIAHDHESGDEYHV